MELFDGRPEASGYALDHRGYTLAEAGNKDFFSPGRASLAVSLLVAVIQHASKSPSP